MCMMSLVMEYVGDRVPTIEWDRAQYDWFKYHFLPQVDEFDKRLNQPDCIDPEKSKIMERIEQRLKAIEDRLAITESQPCKS